MFLVLLGTYMVLSIGESYKFGKDTNLLCHSSFQKHFNITPAESANLNGNVVSLLQVGWDHKDADGFLCLVTDNDGNFPILGRLFSRSFVR